MTLGLFGDPPASGTTDATAPLAERMRPRRLDEFVGQDHLVGEGAPLRRLLAQGELPSLILWGPPGSGKTSLARLLAEAVGAHLVTLSAVMAGVRDVRGVMERATRERQRTVLFIDEIHRFNRAQQDALLPHVERGTVTLIGATTENPSFEVNAPLLSRSRVFTLKPLATEQIVVLLERALEDHERGLGKTGVRFAPEALRAVADAADADARRALGILEDATALQREESAAQEPVDVESVRRASGRRVLRHDRDREEHYNVISALIKSLRASDPDAALYYLARLLEAGEDPLFVARRLVIFAAEDVGNAEPQALNLATSTFLAVERIGMPEGRIPLAQATTFLACAPKSNASYLGISSASEAAREHGSLPVPMHLRNAPTGLMRAQGYGRDYRYPHDQADAFVAERNLPDELDDARFYQPTQRGAEREIGERLSRWRERRAAVQSDPASDSESESDSD